MPIVDCCVTMAGNWSLFDILCVWGNGIGLIKMVLCKAFVFPKRLFNVRNKVTLSNVWFGVEQNQWVNCLIFSEGYKSNRPLCLGDIINDLLDK